MRIMLRHIPAFQVLLLNSADKLWFLFFNIHWISDNITSVRCGIYTITYDTDHSIYTCSSTKLTSLLWRIGLGQDDKHQVWFSAHHSAGISWTLCRSVVLCSTIVTTTNHLAHLGASDGFNQVIGIIFYTGIFFSVVGLILLIFTHLANK